MSPADIQALVAAAAPGTRVTVLVFEIPGELDTVVIPVAGTTARSDLAPALGESRREPRPPSASADMPKPWAPPHGATDLARAIASRQTPFTCAELAEILQVKPETVSHWCRTQVLENVPKIPGAGWRIPPASVLAMLAASTPPGAGSRGTGDAPAGDLPAGDVAASERTALASGIRRLGTSDVGLEGPRARGVTGPATPARVGAAPIGQTDTADDASCQSSAGSTGEAGPREGVGARPADVIDGFDLAELGSWRQRRRGRAS